MAPDDAGNPQDSTSRALEASEARFSLLVESVMDYAIFMLDPNGIVQTWNIGASRLKGYERDEIVGRSYESFYPEESRAEGLPQRLLAEARSQGRVRHTGWRVRKDGTRFWADVVITALYEDGELTGFAKVTRDMTEAHELQLAREEALESQRESLARLREMVEWRKQFIAGLAHDLQSPITSITGFADVLLDVTMDPAETRRIHERILSNAESLQMMIDDLRSSAILDARRIELKVEPVEIGQFVRSLIDDMQPLLQRHEVVIGSDRQRVAVDPEAFGRILRNLLTNAARYSPPGARLDIGWRELGEHVEVTVRDEGEGIDPDLLPKVFDRYERGQRGGSGLGLSIVKQYVELHGGQITVDSEVGEGTTFKMVLPAA